MVRAGAGGSGLSAGILRLLERVREVPQGAWDALLGPDSSPFVEWTWLDCLEEAGCVTPDAGWLPRHLALFRKDDAGRERLVAAAPAYVKGNSEGEFVFDWSWADVAHRMGVPYYPKVIVAVPFTPATGDRVLVGPGEDPAQVIPLFARAAREWASEVGASGVHALFPTEVEAERWQEAGYLRRAGFQYHFARGEARTVDEWLATFRSKRRNQIRREMAQPAKDGVHIETLEPAALTPEIVRAMYRLYLSTVDKYTWGRRYLNERFFSLVAERFAHRLAWVVARRGGEVIAGAFNVRSEKRLYGRYWGAFADLPFLHFNVCYYHGVVECLRRGLDVFEPGAGGEHKRVRGFVPTLTHSAHYLHDARLRRLVAPFLERERARVEEIVRTGEAPE